jgi:polyhydroxybutyrate depolymerase
MNYVVSPRSASLRAALVLMLIALFPAASWAGGSASMGTLDFGGMERSYRLFVPSGYRQGTPTPLVVAMHGGLGTGEIFASQSGFDAVAERHGFLVLYPDGYKRGWNAGTCCGPPMKENVDDVGFIAAVVAAVKRQYSVDASRVYGTGFSNGAMLAYRISCEAPDLFVAIAPVSGGLMTTDCKSKQKVSALHIGGLLDKNIPWAGGTYDDTYRRSAKELVDLVAARDGCGKEDKVTESGEGFECRTMSSCAKGTEVSWCRLDGVGHQWAGGKTYMRWILGPNDDRFQTSERIWTFFSRQRRNAS